MRSLLLLGLILSSCTTGSPHFPTAAELPEEPRRPDGVAVDLPGASPAPALADTTSSTLVALQEPVDAAQALAAVRHFFRAVAGEDLDALRDLMAPDASLGPLAAGSGPPAHAQWERRVRRLDYQALGSEPVFRESMVQTYRHRDLQEPIIGRPSEPPNMGPEDVLIRVPIARTRVGVERLFGDEILFVLRQRGRQYRIQAMYEDFQAP